MSKVSQRVLSVRTKYSMQPGRLCFPAMSSLDNALPKVKTTLLDLLPHSS